MNEKQIMEMVTGVINLKSRAVASLEEQLKPSLAQACSWWLKTVCIPG
jgi:hypothetical protein